MKSQKDRTMKDELARLVGAQNMLLEKTIAITQERMKRLGQKQKKKQTNKQKKHSAVDVTGAGSKA